MKLLSRLGIALGLIVAAGAGACALLPDRFAVNGLMLNQLFGIGGGLPEESVWSRIEGPDGWSVGLYAQVPKARLLHFTEGGDLLVVTVVALDGAAFAAGFGN